MRWALRAGWPIGLSSWTPARSSRPRHPRRFSRHRRARERAPFSRRSLSTRTAQPVPRLRTAAATPGPAFAYDQAPHTFARTIAMERICLLLLEGGVSFDVPLSERAIAEPIACGRMPVREALRNLAREGIVSVEPGRGTFLRRLDTTEVTELLEVRLAIEGMAARLAAQKGFVGELPQIVLDLRALTKQPFTGRRIRDAEAIGDRVHRTIVEGAGNEILNSLYAGLRLRIGISLRLVQLREVDRIRETVDEHLAVAEAILARQASRAVKALHDHLRRGHAITMANFARRHPAP